jgi:hypothetical protein
VRFKYETEDKLSIKRDGIVTSTSGIYTKGGTSNIYNPDKLQTQFPYTDGNNYIRGDTFLHGILRVNNRDILAEIDDLKNNSVRIGGNYGFKHNSTGKYLRSEGGSGSTPTLFGEDGWQDQPSQNFQIIKRV